MQKSCKIFKVFLKTQHTNHIHLKNLSELTTYQASAETQGGMLAPELDGEEALAAVVSDIDGFYVCTVCTVQSSLYM